LVVRRWCWRKDEEVEAEDEDEKEETAPTAAADEGVNVASLAVLGRTQV
jgi:hypothetical protein